MINCGYIQNLMAQKNMAQTALMFSNSETSNIVLETKIAVLDAQINEWQGKKLDTKA